MKFATIAAAAIALASSASAAFSSCGSSSDTFSMSGVTYAPNPPKVNQNVCVTLTGTLSQPITTGSTIHVSATFWGISVYDQTTDLCTALAGSATPCPIPTTTTSVTHCIVVPSNVPVGVSINLKAEAMQGAKRIFCIKGPLSFVN